MKKVFNGSQLKNELAKVKLLLEDDFAIVLRTMAIKAWRELLLRSATDTGFLKSKWSISIDQRPIEETLTNPDPKKKYTAASEPSFKVEGDSIVVLYNNTEYAIHLELGTAKMRAQPMVEPTAKMIHSVAKQMADQLSRKKYNV